MKKNTVDIYTYLKRDHKTVNDLFKKIIKSNNSARPAIFKKIHAELVLHADSEQKTFYKVLNKTKKSREEVSHAKEEHKEINDILKKLVKTNSNEDIWLIHLGELKSIVEHHVKEEETEIFPMAKKIIPKTRAYSLVDDMEAEKQKIKSKIKL